MSRLPHSPWAFRRDWGGKIASGPAGELQIEDRDGGLVATVPTGARQGDTAAAVRVLPHLVRLAEAMQRVPCLHEGRECDGCVTCDARLIVRSMGGGL
jgi:hypothetical protein